KQWCVTSDHIRDSLTTRSGLINKESTLTNNKITRLPGLQIKGQQVNNYHHPLVLRSTEETVKKSSRWSPASSRLRGSGVYLSELLRHLSTRRCREALGRPSRQHYTTINSNTRPQQGRPNIITKALIQPTNRGPVIQKRDEEDLQLQHNQLTPTGGPSGTPATPGRYQKVVRSQVDSSVKRECQVPKRKATGRRIRGRKGHHIKNHDTSLKVKVPEARRRASSLEDILSLASPSPPASIYPSSNIKVVVRRSKQRPTRRRARPNKSRVSHHNISGSSVSLRGNSSRAVAAGTAAAHVSVAVVPHPPSVTTFFTHLDARPTPSVTTWAAAASPPPPQAQRRVCRHQWRPAPQSIAVPHLELTSLLASGSQHATTSPTAAADEQQSHICISSESRGTPRSVSLVLTPKEKRAVVGYFFKKNIVSFLSGDNSGEGLNTTSGGVHCDNEVTRRTTQLSSAPRSPPSPSKLSPIVPQTLVVMANETEQQQNMSNKQHSTGGDVKQVKGYRKKGLVNEKVLLERLSDMSIEDDALAPVIVLSSVEDIDDISPMESESAPCKTSGKKKGTMKQMNSLSLDVPCQNVMDEPKRPPM
ncbi:unnamed protein product, partial [Meganyctiphanes norvegica]